MATYFPQILEKYKVIDPSHPIFSLPDDADLGLFWPYTIHGDEGRGRNKTPVMVESFCPVISRRGMKVTNLKGQLMHVESFISCFVSGTDRYVLGLRHTEFTEACLPDPSVVHSYLQC